MWPEQRVEVVVGLVRIYSPKEAMDPFNFLNIPLESYSAKDVDLFTAENRLRWAIKLALEPEKYVNGFNGDYGPPTTYFKFRSSVFLCRMSPFARC